MTNGARPPLEAFIRDYLDVAGGDWDEVEPDVYDLLLPARASSDAASNRDVVRIVFDPEALPEHPGSQLAGIGTPLVDRLLESAARLGRFARAYVGTLNLAPRDLTAKVLRTLQIADGLKLDVGGSRAMDFPQAVFWFQATLASDQKESYVLPVAVDLHYARQVRHLDELLADERLSDQPTQLLPQVTRCTLAEAFPLARAEVVRTLGSLAGARCREHRERVDRQVARMGRYYSDLRDELNVLAERANTRGDDSSKYAGRRAAIDREERLRVAELRQKGRLHVQLRLANLLVVHQPKLLIDGVLLIAGRGEEPLPLVWDPLVGSLEAVPCPGCIRPTFRLATNPRHQVCCPACSPIRTSFH